MSSQVRDTPNGVALHLDVRRKHLTDEGLEAAELDDGELVLGCEARINTLVARGDDGNAPLTAKLPNAALAAR